MQGSTRVWLPLMMMLLAGGCGDGVEPDAPGAAAAERARTSFEPRVAGAIGGRVVWQGEIPHVPDFEVHAYLDYLNASRLRGRQPNPHAPKIDPDSRGVIGAVVFLRQVKPGIAKAWPHAPVRVETDAEQFTVLQGKERRQIGFVPRGGEVEFVSRDSKYHNLQARGAAFFTLPLVVADRAARRRLDEPGLVELSEGTGLYWRRAYLFVLENPYATLTDAGGEFTLADVPPGTYDLTVWLPNWHVAERERDPESAAIRRVVFAPAGVLTQSVTVEPRSAAKLVLTMSSHQFGHDPTR